MRAERNQAAAAVASSAAAAAQQLGLLLSAGHQPNSTQYQSEKLLGEESVAHRRRVVMDAAAAAGLPALLQAASTVVDSDLAALSSAITAASGLGVSRGTAADGASHDGVLQGAVLQDGVLQEDMVTGTAAPSASEAEAAAAEEGVGSPEAVMDRQLASTDLKPAAARRLQFGRGGVSDQSVRGSAAPPGTVTVAGVKGERMDDRGHQAPEAKAKAESEDQACTARAVRVQGESTDARGHQAPEAEAEGTAGTASGRPESPPLQQLQLPAFNFQPPRSREHIESSVNDVEAVLEVAIVAPLIAQHRCLGRACCR